MYMEKNIQAKASPSQFTYSMEKSLSWQVSWFSASQEIPRVLWNPKVHYCIHKCLPPVPVLSQTNPVHAHKSHFLKILLNIILPSLPESSKWPLSLRFPDQHPVHTSTLPRTCYMPRPPHSSRFDHTNNTGWGVHIIKLLIMYFSPLPCYLNPLHSSIHWKPYNWDNYSLWITV
jgi:hypothetical protein